MMTGSTLSDMYAAYFYNAVFWMVAAQAAFVGVLIMPLPSNYFRGMIIAFVDKVWSVSPHVRLYLKVIAWIALIWVYSCSFNSYVW